MQIHEIVKFRERLNNSLQFASLTAEKMILELLLEVKSRETMKQVMTNLDIDPVHDKTAWHELTDNRDVRIFREWGACRRRLLEESLEHSRQEETTWLRIRNLLLRALAASYSLTQRPQQGAGDPPTQGPDGHGDRTGQANGEQGPGSMPHNLTVLCDLLASLREVSKGVEVAPKNVSLCCLSFFFVFSHRPLMYMRRCTRL